MYVGAEAVIEQIGISILNFPVMYSVFFLPIYLE